MATDSSRRVHLLDAAVVVWTVLWIALGALSFVEVRGLRSLSSTMSLGGQSLQNAADALDTLAAVPLVGGGLRDTADEVQRLANETVAEAEKSSGHIERLSVLVLLMGGIVPIVCGIATWALVRRSWTRTARSETG